MEFPNWIIGVLLACMASFVSNLGLNLQKLNHLRNDRAAAASSSATSSSRHIASPTSHLPPQSCDVPYSQSFSRQAPAPLQLSARSSTFPASSTSLPAATLLSSSLSSQTYPSYQSTDDSLPTIERRSFDRLPSPSSTTSSSSTQPIPLHTTSYSIASPAVSSPYGSAIAPLSRTPSPPPSPLSYHRQTLWRIGLFLVVLGSLADFVALIFAAQSIIAPLGSLTLVSNTVLAPLLLNEHVGTVDVLATVAIVMGSSLSVACADHRDRLYGLDELFGLFIKPRFVCYSLFILAVIAGLYYHIRYLTSTSSRKHTRFCYAALAGIVGAQSVLFAKCVGTMLVDTLTGSSPLYLHLWSWVIVGLLTLSTTFQIHYLNEGLRLFTASYVVPVYQSCWVLTSCLSGMIFFGEYKGVMDQWSTGVGFPIGVIVVVAAVYVLSQRGGTVEDEGGMEGEEEDGEVAEDGEELAVAGGDSGKDLQRKEQVKREEDERRRAKAVARLQRLTAHMPYQLPITASQSHHIAFPSASSSSFFLQVPYPPRSMRRPVSSARSRSELQTAPIVSSPVLYMQLSSSSPEASYVPDTKEVEERGNRVRPVDGESKVREQLYD